MPEMIENRMVVDSEWGESAEKFLPICKCCEEKIEQFRALRILYGREKIWLCDRCIEGLKEVTGY